MKTKILAFFGLIFMIFVAPLCAEITMPDTSVSPPNPIIANLSLDQAIPEGAQFDGGWEVSAVEGEQEAKFVKAGSDTIYIWAEPGKYTVSFSGFWIHLKEVTFTDGEGNKITITSYLGHGRVNEEAVFEVTVANPPNPGPTPGAKQVMLFYHQNQLDDLPTSQQRILNSLSFREDLREAGHVLLEIVEASAIDTSELTDEQRRWYNAISDKPLPQIAWANKNGGTIKTAELPETPGDLFPLLGD